MLMRHALDPSKLSAGRLKCFYIRPGRVAEKPYSLMTNAHFDKQVEAKKADEAAVTAIELEICNTGKSPDVVVFEHLYMNGGDGVGETLPIPLMVEELAGQNAFFKRFKSVGQTKTRYKNAEFLLWMAKNFPGIEKKMHSNKPHFAGLKRKR